MTKIDKRGVSDFVISKPAGFLRVGTISSIDPDFMIASVKLRSPSIGSNEVVSAQLPISFLSSGGGFIGGWVKPGTPVVVSQAEGSGSYFIVQFLARDPAARNRVGASKITIPTLVEGQITIQSNALTSINLDSDGIRIGEDKNLVSFDTNRKLMLNTFDASYSLTQGSREITGIVRRDRNPKINFASTLRTFDPSYDDNLKIIGMDPVAVVRNSNSGSSVRNPARIEKREVVFEYEDFAKIQSNDIELKLYNEDNSINISNIINRREGRADALSLSLVAPNYLIETIKGTVIDIFGNMLDINRNIIPIGRDNLSVSKIKSTLDKPTLENAYEQIKREERKSLAYHFEINARKETKGSGPPSVSNRDDYARSRSRFFFDVDKEGQFKLNVPASSETGNVPLLTRYENYSTISPDPVSNDPNALVFNDDYKDIFAEPFANNQVIQIKDVLNTNAAPMDRFSDPGTPIYIKHGTAYHDIGKTCISFQKDTYYNPPEYIITSSIASGRISPLNDVVSTEILVSGANANAGGRSGQINFDGSIEINIGANTVDRQSLWLDTQGGIVANIGRDLNNNASLVSKFDGNVYVEIGGTTVPSEKGRFKGNNTGLMAGAFDVRVYNAQGELTILRIDNEGLTISTPGRLVMYANQDIMMRSAGAIHIDGEDVILQGRKVVKDVGRGQI
jgi:hypothetical protein